MPIDTASKRRSASGVGHRIGGRGITPNASKPAAWRQQVGWGYAGIESEEDTSTGPPGRCAAAAVYVPGAAAAGGYVPGATAAGVYA